MGDDGGEKFRRLFVLFAMAIVLAPTSNYTIDFSLLRAVQDASCIRHLDWCGYVFDQLTHGVGRCRDGSSTLRGCILVVVLAYFHRMKFKEDVMSSEIPLIKHWNEATLIERAVLKIKAGVEQAPKVRPLVVDKPQPGRKYMELPDWFETDNVIRVKAVDAFQAHCLMMKRDVEIFFHLYTQRKETMEKECVSSSAGDDSRAISLVSTTPSFISDDNSMFIRYFDFVSEKAAEMQRAGSRLPSFKNFCKEVEVGQEKRKSDGGLEKKKRKVDYGLEKGKSKVADLMEKRNLEEATDDHIVDDESSFLKTLDDVVGTVTRECLDVGGRRDNYFVNTYLLHSDVTRDYSVFLSDGIGCGLACGSPDPDVVVVSKFLCEFKELFAPILKLRKDVLDYCFLSDHDLREGEDLVVFSFHNMLTREDVVSLYAKTMITSNVIDCWAIFLNDMVFKAGKELSPSRSFFLTSHSVFIPVHYGKHFFCVVVNFLRKTVDYLDNRVELFGSFLVTKGFESGKEVFNFKFVNVHFDWKYEGPQNLDCGVFVMMHMMFYVGELFTSELGDPFKRIIYRAEIAVILVLAEINKQRDKLLPLVEAFTKVKVALLPGLIEKRRLEALEAERVEEKILEAARLIASVTFWIQGKQQKKGLSFLDSKLLMLILNRKQIR
ncbi:hypothetical protein RND81_07G020400 [Saponaria officinalis]|uniref:Ubiquitin-like protease family profile domain-containing protein n=1 Tax=Saponaria officinalis TaxID=3572 RepID=A0AAW1JPV8_SAPOF